jgi:hypothetical protein
MHMDDFTKYEWLRNGGAQPREVFDIARADGLDLLALIRLLRTVFGLSLAEAKKAGGLLDILNAKQKLVRGATVYWEDATTEEGFYIMEARVTRVADGMIHVEGHKKYRFTDAGLEEVPAGCRMTSVPVGYFDKTLAERISGAVRFWQDLSETPATRRAV